jgi:RNase P subunit RPR2
MDNKENISTVESLYPETYKKIIDTITAHNNLKEELKQEVVILCPICREEMKFSMRTHNHLVYKCKKCGGIHYE